MNEQNEKPLSEGEAEQVPTLMETRIDPSCHEAPEIEGWALQWDTFALRKLNLAREMQHLRHASADQ